MSQLHDVQSFIDLSRTVKTPGDLHNLMQNVTLEMGFDYFALVHHVDLRPTHAVAGRDVTGDFVTLSSYPQSWIEQYVSDDIVSNDPVLLASQRTSASFGWDQLGELIEITDAHREITERTRNAGLMDGFTVPANVPGELNGSCNFAMGRQREVPKHNFAMAHVVGSFAFQAARSLVANMRDINHLPHVKLSQRELECIVLVARGKSDWEIARILGLSQATVSTYVKRIRERYDVPTRIQVVLRALYEGTIPFSELF